jgi:hypothetical protein
MSTIHRQIINWAIVELASVSVEGSRAGNMIPAMTELKSAPSLCGYPDPL